MIQPVFTLPHGSAFPIVPPLIFAQKPDVGLHLLQTVEDLFNSRVNEKSGEDDKPPVGYDAAVQQKYCSLFW